MNYHEIYNALITRAQKRNLVEEIYTENHHIIPRCLWGSNDKDNLVKLTGREHYIAHLLLWKMHPKNSKLMFAFKMMCTASNHGKRITYRGSRFYESARIQFKHHLKNLPIETRLKISNANKGRKQSKETKEKRVATRARNKKPYSLETIENYKRAAKKLRASGWKPNTSGLKCGHVKGEFKHSEESKQQMSKAKEGKTYEEIYGAEAAAKIKERKKLNTGSKNPNFKTLDAHQIKQLIDDGKTIKEIGLIINSNYITISNRFKDQFSISISEYTDSKGITKNGARLKQK
jgi:hypothetical protein